jgi:3-oxoacyl-[acyl-carrier-protein] synthase-1
LRRVVVTGLGIVSCLGNRLDAVAGRLRDGRPGLRHMPDYAERGMKSHVAGVPDLAGEPPIDRKHRRFMGDAAIYAWHAMTQAVADAGLTADAIGSRRTGLIVGSGVGSPFQHHEAIETMRRRGAAKVPPYVVPQVMGNTVSASLATGFGIHGTSYGLTSACATGTHCIGHAAELIQLGKQDVVFAGGAEEVCWTSSLMFDAMGVLATGHNAEPQRASRPFDADRSGFVIAGGAAVVVLEAAEHAKARNARVYGELAGYGASAGGEMLGIDPTGAAQAMRLALDQAGGTVDYLNAHATGTPTGDAAELNAIRAVFGKRPPLISSTKGLTGHAVAASGAQEAVYSLLMMRDGFIAANANLEGIEPGFADLPLVRETLSQRPDTVMSNSFGFGGTNACLIFRRS